MRTALMVSAALLVLAAGWFFAGDDGGRFAALHLFDNMNDRPLADSQQVRDDAAPGGRLVRLVPPSSVAHGMNGAYSGRVRDAAGGFAGEASYLESGRMQGDDGGMMPAELGGTAGSRGMLAQGRALFRAHCAVCHGQDGGGRGSMAAYSAYPQVGSFRDARYAGYSAGRIFRSIRLGQGNMPAFGSVLSVREIWCLVAAVREMQAVQEE